MNKINLQENSKVPLLIAANTEGQVVTAACIDGTYIGNEVK